MQFLCFHIAKVRIIRNFFESMSLKLDNVADISCFLLIFARYLGMRIGLVTCIMLFVLPSVMIGQTKKVRKDFERDSLTLSEVYVFGKSKAQQTHDGAYAVSVVDMRELKSGTQNLADIVARVSGMKIRQTGGMGSDFDLNMNGMMGNSIRIFIDGTPINQLGSNVTLQNLPISNIDRVEVYKGVVPAEFGADALGGIINIVTSRKQDNHLEASVSAGSFHTYEGEVSGRWSDRRTGIYVRPQVSCSYAKNDYTMRGMKVWDESRDEYVLANRKRFHDAYDNVLASVETGFENKPWADQLSVAASYTHTDKQMQTGSVQNIVYGAALRKTDAWNVQTRYRKHDFLTKGLSVNSVLSYTWDNALVVDTACRRYDWNGNYVLTDRNETTGRQPMLRRIKRPLLVARLNLDYKISNHHSLNLNYMVTSTGNRRTDDLMLDYDFVPSNDRLTKHIVGLTYAQNFLDERLTNSFFVKEYAMKAKIEQTDFAWKTNLEEVGNYITANNVGGGVASRYRFLDELNVKASYERTIRQPLARELLGNGNNIYANLALRPERSHNINLGLFGETRFHKGDHRLQYEVNAFLRYVQDYIRAVVSEAEGTYQYENVQNVDVRGIEGELHYRYEFGQKRNRLEAGGNMTWVESVNKNRTMAGGKPSVIYGNKIPNTPWLLGNGELNYSRQGVFFKHDRLRLEYQYQYVHWFFLTWEGFGALKSKSTIPTQHNHSLHLAYSWLKDRYTVTLSCENLADATLYDNYKLQKPGRCVMAKFRLLLK